MDLGKYIGLDKTGKYGNSIPMVYALFAVVLLPYLHIGSYEEPGMSRYKHVYFNATKNTFKIWVLTVIFLLMLYESVKHVLTLLRTSHLHYGWASLYVANIYPHYYSWWNFFGYYNDEFYSIFQHQLFFCITELCVSAIVVSLCNTRGTCQSWKLLAITSVSLVHIIISGWDQFVTNVLRAKGASFQTSRDLGFMIPDICHVAFASFQYWRHYLSKNSNCLKVFLSKELATFVALTICLTFVPTFL